jgi:spore coat protein U-like protein
MNLELKRIAGSIALVSALAAPGTALAATQGSLDATASEGTLGVSVEIEDRVQITGLNDIDFGVYGGTGPLSQSDGFCVYRNGTGLYDIALASATGAGTDFEVTDGTNNAVYTVKFDDDADASDASDVDNGDSVTGAQGDGASQDCTGSGGVNASLQLTFSEAELQSMATGTYADTITLTVTPN